MDEQYSIIKTDRYGDSELDYSTDNYHDAVADLRHTARRLAARGENVQDDGWDAFVVYESGCSTDVRFRYAVQQIA